MCLCKQTCFVFKVHKFPGKNMALVLQFTKIFLKRNVQPVYKNLISSLYVPQVRCMSSSILRPQTEDLFGTEISSVPSHLLQYAFQPPDSILASFASMERNSSVHFVDTVGFLKALRVQTLLKKVSFEEIKDDVRFHELCRMFVQHSHKLQPAQLVSGLRSLLEIGFPPDSNFVSSVNKIIEHQIEFFDVTQLIGCLHLYSKHLGHDTKEKVCMKLLEAVKSRLSEVYQPAEGLLLIQILHLFDKDFSKIVVENLINIVSFMDTEDLLKVINAQAELGQRNKSLLTAVSMQLQQKELKLSIRDIINIFHSLNALNFYDEKLLLHLTKHCELQFADIQQPSVISALLTICGHLKWRHQGLLDACGQWIVQNSNLCCPREFVSFILTAAALDYSPEDSTILEHIVSCLTFKETISKNVWLDVVWSLAVLNHLDKSMLVDVLSPQFYESLLDENTDSRLLSIRLKLMNLKYVLKSEYPENVLSCDLFLDNEVNTSNSPGMVTKLQNIVLTTLSNLIPKDKFMATDLCTDMGITIDAEFIINKNGKPLSLDIYGVKATSTVTKSIPPGAKRIALMIWLFKDYTLNDRALTGMNALALRLLSSEGYHVMQVPYDEFAQHTTEVKRVVYLSQLIDSIRTKTKKK